VSQVEVKSKQGIKWELGFMPTKSRLQDEIEEHMAENIITY
jgi:hypothetical protein